MQAKNKDVTFKSYGPLTSSMSKRNNTQIGNAKVLDVVLPMYYLIEYSDN